MEFVDTHAHLYLDRFDEDLDAVVDRARAAGVTTILLPAIDVPSIAKALELANRYDGMYVMAALHPTETKSAGDAEFEAVSDYCADPRVVAVGETGLDYYWDRTFDEIQQTFLRRHIRLAAKVDLPLVFHNREASDDLLRIVREEQAASDHPDRIRGVFHCFGGTPAFAASVLETGFMLGIGGTLTFKNAGVPDAIKDVPLERMVLETDAPFLAPVPNRGKRNEPAYTRIVAERLSDVTGRSVDEIAAVTTATAKRLFRLP